MDGTTKNTILVVDDNPDIRKGLAIARLAIAGEWV
jgi:hypothetical protein